MTEISVDGAVVAYPLFQGEEDGSIPVSTLDFLIDEIQMRRAAEINRMWHSLLPRTDLGNLLCGNTSVAYAAEYGNRFYAVAIWSQPIIRQLCDGKTIELRRLAICDTAPKNTASRMLSMMRKLIVRKFPFVQRLISYQAIDVHQGTIYKASGWTPVDKTSEARPRRGPGSPQRSTGPLQTNSPKLRWEYYCNGGSKKSYCPD